MLWPKQGTNELQPREAAIFSWGAWKLPTTGDQVLNFLPRDQLLAPPLLLPRPALIHCRQQLIPPSAAAAYQRAVRHSSGGGARCSQSPPAGRGPARRSTARGTDTPCSGSTSGGCSSPRRWTSSEEGGAAGGTGCCARPRLLAQAPALACLRGRPLSPPRSLLFVFVVFTVRSSMP